MPTDSKDLGTLYYRLKMKWYKKLWYIITFRKNKIKEFEQIKPLSFIKSFKESEDKPREVE